METKIFITDVAKEILLFIYPKMDAKFEYVFNVPEFLKNKKYTFDDFVKAIEYLKNKDMITIDGLKTITIEFPRLSVRLPINNLEYIEKFIKI